MAFQVFLRFLFIIQFLSLRQNGSFQIPGFASSVKVKGLIRSEATVSDMHKSASKSTHITLEEQESLMADKTRSFFQSNVNISDPNLEEATTPWQLPRANIDLAEVEARDSEVTDLKSFDNDAVEQTAEKQLYNDTLGYRLNYTCFRCGEDLDLPCSCSAVCELYGMCCENFAIDCPHTLKEGRSLYSSYYSSGFQCGADGLFKISTCPIFQDDSWLNDSLEVNVDQKSRLMYFQDLEKESEERTFSVAEVQRAILGRPVTDKVSLVSFINSSIFDCHSTSDQTLDWSLQFDYTGSSPITTAELGIAYKTDLYSPAFSTSKISNHVCFANIVSTCPSNREGILPYDSDKEKCSEFTGVVKSQRTKKYYRNRFCAFCNEGRHHDLELIYHTKVFVSGGVALKVLVSLTPSGDIQLEVQTSGRFFSFSSSTWKSVQCSVAGTTPNSKDITTQTAVQEITTEGVVDDELACKATCAGSNYFLGPDGRCSVSYTALIALTDVQEAHSLLQCAVTMTQIAQFVSCSLDAFMTRSPMGQAEFLTPETFIGYDEVNKRNLYIVKINIISKEAAKYFFSSDPADMPSQIHQIAITVKALYKYLQTQNACEDSIDNKIQPNLTVLDKPVDRRTLEKAISIFVKKNLTNEMIRLRGRVVDTNNTSAFCISFFGVELSKIYGFFCLDDMVYETDTAEVNKVSNSHCMDHLTQPYSKVNTATNGQVRHSTIFFLCFFSALIVTETSGLK